LQRLTETSIGQAHVCGIAIKSSGGLVAYLLPDSWSGQFVYAHKLCNIFIIQLKD